MLADLNEQLETWPQQESCQIETMERIIKLPRRKSNTECGKICWLFTSPLSKIRWKCKQNGKVLKENIRVDHGRRHSVRMENSKQYLLKIENAQNHELVEKGVNVCDRTKKSAEWNGIHIQKSPTKTNTSTT